MNDSIEAFISIAGDIGVTRYTGESDKSFCLRTTYSAARFWVSACCMDDGAAYPDQPGQLGVSKQTINHRLKAWLNTLDKLCPGTEQWFGIEDRELSTIYNRLINIGDIQQVGFEDTYRATSPHILPATAGSALLTGFFDISDSGSRILGHKRASLVTSGLATLVEYAEGERPITENWWETDLDYLSWKNATEYENVRFFNPAIRGWGSGVHDGWTDSLSWVDGPALAKVDIKNGTLYFIARRTKGGVIQLSEIRNRQAKSLLFFLRYTAKKPFVVRYQRLDDKHARFRAPFGSMPGRLSRLMDAVTWPIEKVDDCRGDRIFRLEALSLIKDLLAACYIGLKE